MAPKKQTSAATELAAGNSSAAPEHTEELQLAEIVNQEAGLSTAIELKVVRNELVHYTYWTKGEEKRTQKVQIVLQSKVAEQYCLGIAKLKGKDAAELKKVQERWQTGTTWKFTSITLQNDKPAYIHTSCRIAIDLRQSQAQALLQSTSFPQSPVPTVTIADVLQLTKMQRFDLMAIVAKILDERKAGTGMMIADVRLVDGSKNDNDTDYASLPLTLFFKTAAELSEFKLQVGKTPMLFMSLSGKSDNGQVNVITIKDQSWRQEAVGTKALAMAEQATLMCGDDAPLRDVAALQTFVAREAVDYISPMATLTVCQLVDPMDASPTSQLGEDSEHLYQLNHVHVTLPTKEASIKTKDDRLFTRLDVWDGTRKIKLAFRSKAMLQLASLQKDEEQEYEKLLATDELRHPLLVSLRLLVQRKKPDATDATDATATATATEHSQTQSDIVLSSVVVEAEPCTLTDIPDDSVEAMHGLFVGSAQTSERLAAVPLDKLRPSPFYNMLADGKPVEKALTLLHFTQRSNGKQHNHGFRIITERAQDATAGVATELTKENCYATVALCTVEKSPDFAVAKDATAMAVISKVVAPSKPLQHAADLYIEAMEPVPKADVASATAMMRKLHRISNAQSADPTTSTEVAWQQRKCRRLLRYPTIS
jgi:ribulose bisphosphate carboxylase small subunit